MSGMRFAWIDPVHDVGMGVPYKCHRCGEPVEIKPHPCFFGGRTSSLRGKQWTCECSTWGAA